MCQLFRVAHDVNRDDLTVADVERDRHHGTVGFGDEVASLAVDSCQRVDEVPGQVELARQALEEARDIVSAENGTQGGGSLSSPVRMQDRVFGEQPGQGLHISRPGCDQESLGDSCPVLSRNAKPRARVLHVGASPGCKLAAGRLGFSHRPGHFPEIESEDVMQQKRRAFQR